MSELEIGLQQIGLLEAVRDGCRVTGLSIADFLRYRIAGCRDPADNVSLTQEKRNKLAAEIFDNMMKDPDYFNEIMQQEIPAELDWEIAGEEAWELCQD